VSWERDGVWATPIAARGFGFAASSDTTCPVHGAIWNAMGIANDATHHNDSAAKCAGASAHTATTQCTANMPTVHQLLTM
jgi:hypothetical protein